MFRIPRRHEIPKIPKGFIGNWVTYNAMSYMMWIEDMKRTKEKGWISEYQLTKNLRLDKKTLRNNLKPLIERGFIECKISERPSAPIRKGRDYRLTGKGREWVVRFGSIMRDLFPEIFSHY